MPRVILLADFSEEYFKKILLGIARYSKESGQWAFCRMPVYYRETLGLEGIVRWAKEWGADGMFAQLDNTDDTPELENVGFPIVVTDYRERFKHAPNITGNYYLTGQIGAQYFLDKGFTNFAYYGDTSFVWSRERGIGYSAKLKEKGFSTYFFDQPDEVAKEMWYYKPSALSQWVSNLPKPLALMACDDNCGQQLTEACKLAGIKIPEEVAVLGVDNDELICSLSDPALSSIHLDAETGGYLAAQLMERLIGNPSLKYNVLIEPTRIITRQSTDIYATADKHIAMALKFIHQNIYNTLTVNDIVREIPLSRRAFEMKFKKATNQSVYQYILNLRAASFAEQLCQTEMPVLDIVQGMGMPDSGNFGRRFKQIMGSSPNAYRKQNKK